MNIHDVWLARHPDAAHSPYLDNGKQFIAKKFRQEAGKSGIKLIFGKPHNPRGRGKIERYHKTLYRELIAMNRFRSLSHFRREL